MIRATTARRARPGRGRGALHAPAPLVLAVILSLAVTACGASGGAPGGGATSSGATSGGKPLMTPAQATAYADGLLYQTAAVMMPRPRLDRGAGSLSLNYVSPCLGGPDASDLVVVNRGFWLSGISAKDNATIGEQVLAYWKARHWQITMTLGIGTSSPAIIAVVPPYALGIDLQVNSDGQPRIEATSICLPPHGTKVTG